MFIQLGTQPLFSAGNHTLQNDVVEFCGSENIFANSAVQWPQVSREQVLTRKPDVYYDWFSRTGKTVKNFGTHSSMSQYPIK